MTKGKAYREYNTTLPPGIFDTFGLSTFVQKPRPEATYVTLKAVSIPEKPRTKDQISKLQSNCRSNLNPVLSQHATALLMHLARMAIFFLWIACAMTDQPTTQ